MHQVFRKPVLKMLDCSVKWSFNKVLLQTFEGIKICDMAGFGKPPDLLVRDRIVAALTLVKSMIRGVFDGSRDAWTMS